MTEHSKWPDTQVRWLGILADPEVAPVEVADHLAQHLPTRIAEAIGDQTRWRVEVEYERLPAGGSGHTAMINRAEAFKVERDLELVVCVTDLPIRSGRNPIVAELSTNRGIAVVSLPAFGAMALRRRSTLVTVYLISELLGLGGRLVGDQEQGPTRFGADRRHRRRLSRQLRSVSGESDGIDLRVVTTRGRLRLLIGMVRDNRPWRLARGLTRAVVAAFALSAFYLVSSGVWELSSALGPVRMTIGSIGSLVILVTWLIIRHNLWEKAHRRNDHRYPRDQLLLFNATTVLTLAIGTLCLYAVLFVAVLAAAFLFVSADVLGRYANDPDLGTYLSLSWMTSSVATLAGAVGTGLDSEKAVRAAAYSTRERQRRARWERERRQEDHTEEQLPDPEQRQEPQPEQINEDTT